MWPRFGPRVGRLGVHSALSLPLLLPDQVVGATTCTPAAKTSSTTTRPDWANCSPSRPRSLYTTPRFRRRPLLTVQLQTALSTRPVIDQAIGLIRGRTGRSVEDAFAHLRAISQAEHRKLADVAHQIVDEAVRRARARHKPTG